MYIVGVLPCRLLCTRHLVNTLYVPPCFSVPSVPVFSPDPRTCRPCSLACPFPLAARPLVTSLPAAPLRTPAPSPPAAPPRSHPAEDRLGFRMRQLNAIPVARMLAEAKYEPKGHGMKEIKKQVYSDIVKYLDSEGYPTESDPNFNEANFDDLVYTIISPILSAFGRNTGRAALMHRGERSFPRTVRWAAKRNLSLRTWKM